MVVFTIFKKQEAGKPQLFHKKELHLSLSQLINQ
jgi:hypothetical protein